MSELLQGVAAVLGGLAAFLASVVSFLQLRRERHPGRGELRSSKIFSRLIRPRWILAFGLLLALVSSLLVLQLILSEEEPPPGAALLSNLTTAEARDCASAPPAEGGSVALTCAIRSGPVLGVTLTLFPSVSELRASIERREAELGVGPGSCYSQVLASESSDNGTLICDYGGGGRSATLEWSREDSRVLVQATAAPDASPPELYDWWQRDGTGSPANNRLPYPDGFETYVIETAAMKASECVRDDPFRDSYAALNCEASIPDFFFLGFYDDHESLRGSVVAERSAPGSCRYRDREPKLSGYVLRGERAGVRACYHESEEGKVVVEWTNEQTRIYAYASVDGPRDRLYGLFSWWDRVGKYLTD